MKVIGIDIGGTTIKGGLFVDGSLMKTASVPSNSNSSREGVLASLFSIIENLKDAEVEKIGIVSAGEIDPNTGICRLSCNLKGWTGCPIKDYVEKRFGILTNVDNDAVGALIGEASLFPTCKNVTMLIFGTGVGGASLVDGRIQRGAASELGHRVLVENGRPCFCGKNGCAEKYLSATALRNDAAPFYGEPVPTTRLTDDFLKGEEKAVLIMKQYGLWLNAYLRLIEADLHPDFLILGGGLMNAQEAMRRLITFPANRYSFAKYGDVAGIIGASKLPFIE